MYTINYIYTRLSPNAKISERIHILELMRNYVMSKTEFDLKCQVTVSV